MYKEMLLELVLYPMLLVGEALVAAGIGKKKFKIECQC